MCVKGSFGSECGSQLWWLHQNRNGWSYKHGEVTGLTTLRSLLGLHQGRLNGIDHERVYFPPKDLFFS